ncbi:CD276 antigen-like [Huso huso]|uniref:CD276 antigen-like n=1 Tax=Huso huso TaxID=61971 RepID=A0ABR0YZ66_HUSHU
MNKLLFIHVWLHVCVAVTVPRSPVTSPPGSDVTLDCSFSYKAGADLTRVVVTWQCPPDDHVVHSFYYGRDQLALQNEAYRNRTQLFPEQLSVGNATLRLKQVRGEDDGWYTCAVTNQVENTRGRHAAHSGSATVQWLNETGCDITERSKTSQSLDSRGLVELRSQMLEQR